MRFTLLLSVFCLCASLKAQTEANLKEFINKNNVAIRSVQKNMIAQNVSGYNSTFKELLKQQEAAIKTYSSDNELSYSLAFTVRKECLDFLKKHYKGSTAYYDITSDEQKLFSPKKITDKQILSDSELKTISDLDVTNFQSLNNLPLTIQ